jgi:YidC/Oxa1 family membrane protein insertase
VFVIAHFPAGLVLYWVTTNLWTVGQGLITRRLMPRPAAPEKRSSRTAPKVEPGDDNDPGNGNGAGPKSPDPTPQPSAKAGPPRKVRRKKGAGRR